MKNDFIVKVISDTEKTLNILIRDAVREELSVFSTSIHNKQTDPIEYLNRRDAAKLLQVSMTQLYYLQKKGVVGSYRVGSKVYFKKSDLLNSFEPSSISLNRKGGKK